MRSLMTKFGRLLDQGFNKEVFDNLRARDWAFSHVGESANQRVPASPRRSRTKACALLVI